MKSRNFYLVLTILFLFVSACSTSRSAVAPDSKPVEEMKAVDPYMGTWAYEVADTPMGTVTGDMVIAKNAEGYEGYLESEIGRTPLYDFQVIDNALNANFDYEGYQISVKGNFNGDSFMGEMGADTMIFPMKADRKK